MQREANDSPSDPFVVKPPQPAMPPAEPPPRLEVDVYQLAPDEMFAGNRPDGTGWSWGWADWRRDWMDQTANKFAYRCLPLTIANQTGWCINNPVGFTAIWTGGAKSDGILFKFDADPGTWRNWINSQFGYGVLTWSVPFLFRTRPAGSRLLVMGPANRFKHAAQPMTAVLESDWMSASFTMNYKLTLPGQPVRFEVGEPLLQIVPLTGNVCADLETATVTYRRVGQDPAMLAAYTQWKRSRDQFKQGQQAGQVDPDAWQRDYFRGRDALGQTADGGHRTKVTPPTIKYLSPPPGKGT
jgi:hypothetical protein